MKQRVWFFFKNHWPFVLVLFIGATLRFYRLPEMALFEFDQEYASNFAYSVLKEFPIQMIGQGLSIQGLFMGPLYFYFLVPFFAVFNLHPLGGAVGSVILGLIIISTYYYIGNKFFTKPAGLIAAFLRAILFSRVEADWSMVPSYSSELAVLLTWYFFYRYWQGKTYFLPLIGLVFGFYTSFHPIQFPFYLIFPFIFLLRWKLPGIKTLFLSIVAFVVPVVPLILFEYFHRFLEVKRLLEVFSSSSASSVAFSFEEFLKYGRWIFREAPATGTENPYLISITVFILIILFTVAKISVWRDIFHLFFLCLTLIVFILYYSFLPANISEYYFLAPCSLLFFYLTGILGYISKNILGRLMVILFLTCIVFVNIGLFQRRWAHPNLTNLANKDKIVKTIIEKAPGSGKFFVSYIYTPGWNFGFNYFFKLYNYPPHDWPVTDETYTIVIPKNLSSGSIDISSGNVGLILPDVQKTNFQKKE